MTPIAVAEMLEAFARRVRDIRVPSHRDPHRFVEDKSELAGDMAAEAKRLRSMAAPRRELPVRPVGEIATGTRSFGRREVAVVTKARRA